MAMIGVHHDQLPTGAHAIGQVSFGNQGRARGDGAQSGLTARLRQRA